MNDLAVEASLRTGMALTPGQAPSAPVPELYASAAYFRSLGVGSDFLYVDIGASSATFALWLRGMDRPAESFTVPLGMQTVLLGRLLRKPEAL